MGLFGSKSEEVQFVDDLIDNSRQLNRLLRREQKSLLKSNVITL